MVRAVIAIGAQRTARPTFALTTRLNFDAMRLRITK